MDEHKRFSIARPLMSRSLSLLHVHLGQLLEFLVFDFRRAFPLHPIIQISSNQSSDPSKRYQDAARAVHAKSGQGGMLVLPTSECSPDVFSAGRDGSTLSFGGDSK